MTQGRDKNETDLSDQTTICTSAGGKEQMENEHPGIGETGTGEPSTAARFLYPAAVIAVAILLLVMVAV